MSLSGSDNCSLGYWGNDIFSFGKHVALAVSRNLEFSAPEGRFFEHVADYTHACIISHRARHSVHACGHDAIRHAGCDDETNAWAFYGLAAHHGACGD